WRQGWDARRRRGLGGRTSDPALPLPLMLAEAPAGSEGFHLPPWGQPLDVEACLAAIPAASTIKSFFILPMLEEARRRGVVLPAARERYLPFADYPIA